MRSLMSIVCLSCCAFAPAKAQWFLGVDVGSRAYRGSSRDTTHTHATPEGRPGSGVALTLLIDRQWRRTGAAIRVSYSNTGFTVTGNGLNLTDRTTGQLLETSLILN